MAADIHTLQTIAERGECLEGRPCPKCYQQTHMRGVLKKQGPTARNVSWHCPRCHFGISTNILIERRGTLGPERRRGAAERRRGDRRTTESQEARIAQLEAAHTHDFEWHVEWPRCIRCGYVRGSGDDDGACPCGEEQ